ncbi:MAG: hypothetical protein FD167_1250 [bacterium]|nr:MAG: hypothetical protein FD167_1250 [bacterium]
MAITNLSRKPTNKKSNKKSKENISDPDDGVIKLDTSNLKLPTQLIEEQSEVDKPFWEMEPVILVIFGLAIGFISFITILISRIPIPTK